MWSQLEKAWCRIYYSVTAAGSRRLANLAATWTNLTSAIGKVLKGGRLHGAAI
jgi:PadR family transcriptional regulator, regulatory protein PadR